MILPLCLLLLQSAATLSDQAQEQAAQRNLPEAEKLWRESIRLDAKFFPALFNLGLLLNNTQRWAEAEQMLLRAVEVRPTDFNAHYVRGTALSRLNRVDDAIREWRTALKSKPDHLRLLQLLTVEYGKGRYFQEAAEAARRLVRLSPDDANLYFLAIKACQDAGDNENAFLLAQAALKRFPNHPRAHFETGFYLAKKGELEEASAHLKKAMELDPSYEEPYFFYADLQVKQGNNAEAIEPLRAAIRLRSGYVPARVLLARAYINLERFDDAMKELNLAIAEDATHPQPHLLLSQIYFRRGDEVKAKQEREISLKLRRENPTVLEAVQGRPFPAR